jgi:hypothetical protein
MVQLNLAVKPKFTRPELLLHPSVPKYLSGVNPRTIKGQEWWDVVRKGVYAENNFCCWACGVYQLDAVYEQFLDAHETYTYDYEEFEARPGEVVALCQVCHWFIHFRRVRYLHIRKEVVIRGLRLLADVGSPVPYWQHRLAVNYGWQWGEERYPNLVVQEKPFEQQKLLSGKWKLVLEGIRYPKEVQSADRDK